MLMSHHKSPNPDWCVQLLPGTEESEESSVVEPFTVIKRVVDECSYSGAYVNYGVRVLGQSIQCFFFRHARIHLSAVLAHASDTTPEFINYVWRLVDDYKLIADKLVAVNQPFMNVVQLATFFHDVANGSVTLDYGQFEDEGVKRDVDATANTGALPNNLTEQGYLMYETIENNFDSLCAVKSKQWFDADTNEFVNMAPLKFKARKKEKQNKKEEQKKGKKQKKNEEDKENKAPKSGPKDGEGTSLAKEDKPDKEKEENKAESMVRLNQLQTIMRNMFEKLLFKKLPDECWTQMFANFILIKSSEIYQIQQTVEDNMSGKSDDESLEFFDE